MFWYDGYFIGFRRLGDDYVENFLLVGGVVLVVLDLW